MFCIVYLACASTIAIHVVQTAAYTAEPSVSRFPLGYLPPSVMKRTSKDKWHVFYPQVDLPIIQLIESDTHT